MLSLPFAANKTFLIFGYGKSGAASAAALRASGGNVLVWDDQQAAKAKAQKDGFSLADPDLVTAENLHAIVTAPGIPLSHPVLERARKKGVTICSDLDLLFQAQKDATFVGVTGTNGKSTTTALIAHILKKASRKVQMGGNIGTPALALESLGKEGIYVLELSSYQLDLIQSNPLNVAVLLNITPDHIERHGSMAGYSAAKRRIVRAQDQQALVIGIDTPETKDLFEELKEKNNLSLYALTSGQEHEKNTTAHHIIAYAEGKLALSFDPHPINLAQIKTLPGIHNAQNAAAAAAACHALGLSRAEVEAGLRTFEGLAHRQQEVAVLDGVRFVNDSKATNADAAAKALVCYDALYWILGGRPKRGGLDGLEPFLRSVRHAFLIGEAEEEFAAWCQGKVPFTRCRTLDVAVQKAAAMAWADGTAGACVLLSPACASFDQYSCFEERGERFAALVGRLSAHSPRGHQQGR